jgi:hypothetical protein
MNNFRVKDFHKLIKLAVTRSHMKSLPTRNVSLKTVHVAGCIRTFIVTTVTIRNTFVVSGSCQYPEMLFRPERHTKL